ncbi:hypothetical protein HW555_000420, partial [Spodoptera exigua]
FEMDMFEDFDISQDDLSQLDQIEINLLNNSFHISSDEEDNIHPVSRNRRRIMVIDSEESESEERPVPATSGQTTPRKRTWTLPTGNQRSIIPFTENPGLPTYLRLAMSKKSPIDFYSLLVPDDVFGQIVEDTNQFAINTITKRNASKAARIRNWSPTNVHEMKSFFALIMFMGLVKLPKLSDYWSKDEITGHRFASTIIAKGAVDLSDQMAAYSSPLRKSVKWYKKVGINLLLNTAVVNALILYQIVTGTKMQIVEFRKQLVKGLLMRSEETSTDAVTRPKRMRHKLARKDGSSKNNRRTCQQCYKENTQVMGRKLAKNKTKKVVTFCDTCPNKPFLCFDCFHKIH